MKLAHYITLFSMLAASACDAGGDADRSSPIDPRVDISSEPPDVNTERPRPSEPSLPDTDADDTDITGDTDDTDITGDTDDTDITGDTDDTDITGDTDDTDAILPIDTDTDTILPIDTDVS